MKTLKATQRLINSVWTLEYVKISETDIQIVRYSRDDQEGYDKESELPQLSIVEGEGRIVEAVLIRNEYKPFNSFVNEDNCDFKFNVVNKKHIFSYEKPELHSYQQEAIDKIAESDKVSISVPVGMGKGEVIMTESEAVHMQVAGRAYNVNSEPTNELEYE